jgi:hypothetical protein
LTLLARRAVPSTAFLFYIQCPSVDEYIVVALATKPHRQMKAISANTVGTSLLASHCRSLFLSIRHPSRQREPWNAVTEGCRQQARGCPTACDQSVTCLARRRDAVPELMGRRRTEASSA